MRLINKISIGNLNGAVYQDSDGLYLYKIRGKVNGKSMVINVSYVYYDTKEKANSELKKAMECMCYQKDLFNSPFA